MSEQVMIERGYAVWARGFDRETLWGFDSPKFAAVSLHRAATALAQHIKANINEFIIEVDLEVFDANVTFDEQGDGFQIQVEIEYETIDDHDNAIRVRDWRLVEFETEQVRVISVQ